MLSCYLRETHNPWFGFLTVTRKSRHVRINDECAEVMATKKGLGRKISCRVSRKINSEGLLVFVQMDNRAMHPNEVPLCCDQARLCLSSSPAIVPHCSDVFLCLARLPDTVWTVYSWLDEQDLNIRSLKLKAPMTCTCVFVDNLMLAVFRVCYGGRSHMGEEVG